MNIEYVGRRHRDCLHLRRLRCVAEVWKVHPAVVYLTDKVEK